MRIGIIGGSGYTGVELLRLLSTRHDLEIVFISSRAHSGRPVSELFANLRGKLRLSFCDPEKVDPADCDLVFFATPNGIAMKQAPAFLDKGVKVIDLSADYRIQNISQWEHWYGMSHASPDWIDKAVYGLPEINRHKISKALLVANPGCYPTAVQLGFLPLLEADLVDTQTLIADAKSGISGAGRSASVSNLLAEASDSFKAYAATGHRHLPEIEQGLATMSTHPISLTFTPHLLPIIRGIHASLYARLTRSADLQSLFEERYQDEPFVDVLPAGSHPETRSVRGCNTCRLAVHQPQGRDMAVVFAVEDNLVKGAAGQAIQNMNIMFGLDETLGLSNPALMP
ncbi:MAG: N-acetyl-gamma-glutamyl-phosphate reductase [Granulosicoccus sp.]|nr:N-acetyl-gamma-glutamyl-phosphate reductase [Granulosicoccus sp.]